MIIPKVCLFCHRVYGGVELGYDVRPGAATHGYCPNCVDKALEQFYNEEAPDEVPGV